jgi:CRP/FNR family transcriptional regulator
MFLNCLDPDEIAVIETIGKIKTYPKGSTLLREGEPGTTFILILSGTVEVRKGLQGLKYKKLVELKACDLIGEIGFLGVHNRTASVVAIEDTEVMEFERAAFMRLIEQHPVIGMKAYRGIAEELAQRLSRSGDDLVDAISWALAQRHSLKECESGVVVPRSPRLARRVSGQ